MKSHFQFTKGQRNGIFLLLFIIIGLQCLHWKLSTAHPLPEIAPNTLKAFEQEIDSLRLVALEARQPKRYPFNPNFITDFKGYQWGMTPQCIDRLLAFRAQGKWINSAAQFQQVTGVSDSLLSVMQPYFKFPQWTQAPRQQQKAVASKQRELSFSEKKDLNQATAKELQTIYGVGDVLSKRIVRYRQKHAGGFIDDIQLEDVYGLSPEVIERIVRKFTVKTPRKIEKIDINTATVEMLVTIQYIDYELAHEIIEQRTLRDGFQSLEQLTKVKGFPIEKVKIIELYLKLD